MLSRPERQSGAECGRSRDLGSRRAAALFPIRRESASGFVDYGTLRPSCSDSRHNVEERARTESSLLLGPISAGRPERDRPRTVQAVPLPLMQVPQPHYVLQNSRIVDEVQVLGYDLDPDPPQPEKPARILVYYAPTPGCTRCIPRRSGSRTFKGVCGANRRISGHLLFPTFRWYEWANTIVTVGRSICRQKLRAACTTST